MPAPSRRTSRPSRLAGWLPVLALALVWLAVRPAAAAETPVMIDNFAGAVLGVRTVTGVPGPNQSTTPPGTFSQSGGVGTIQATGNGDRPGGVLLDYAFPSTDLRGGDPTTRFLVEFASIERRPGPPAGQQAVQVSITVEDAAGGSSSYSTALGNIADANVMLNLECAAGISACFRGDADVADATHLRIQVMYPTSKDATGTLTAAVDTIQTITSGGAGLAPPTPAITVPAEDAVYGAVGTVLEFPVSFRSNGAPVPVSHAPDSPDGLRASDVTVTGTAPGVSSVNVSGGPAEYVIKVGPLTAAGSVQVRIAAGVLNDAANQPTRASNTASVIFGIGDPPEFISAAPPNGQTRARYAHQFASGGNPAAGYSLASGTLPPGLALSNSGRLTGTPTAGGRYAFTVRASNVIGAATQPVTVTVRQEPALTSSTTAAFERGVSGAFTVTADGYPRPDLEVISGILPAGLSFIDDGDGTATLSGTPTTASSAAVTLQATNSVDRATQTLTVEVNVAPVFTSPETATFSAGAAGTFTITTADRPDAEISTDDALPAGLTLTDHGDGTAALSGTVTAPPGSVSVVLKAENPVGTVTQTLTIEITSAPSITSDDTATFTVGAAASFAISTSGRPGGVLSLGDALPAGLSFQDSGVGTATLSGTPTAPGTSATVTVIATNSAGQDTQELTITVLEAPVITSVRPATFTLGTAGSYAITTAGYPAPTITAGALPAGLSFTDRGDGTATLSGTPTGPAATTLVTFTATSATGEIKTGLPVVVNAAPVFTSADQVVFDLGTASSFRITAAGDPAPVIATNDPLPAGMTMTDNGDGSATVAGVPTEDRAFVLDLTAVNATGTARQGLSVVVTAPPEFSSVEATEFTVGEPGSFSIAADGYPAPSLTRQGELPPGLSFADQGDGSAVIAGTPDDGSAGRYRVRVIAANAGPVGQRTTARAAGTETQELVITVRAASSTPSPSPASPSTGSSIGAGGNDGDDEEAGTDLEGLASAGGPALAAAGVGLLLALGGAALVGVSQRRSGRQR